MEEETYVARLTHTFHSGEERIHYFADHMSEWAQAAGNITVHAGTKLRAETEAGIAVLEHLVHRGLAEVQKQK